MQSRPLQQKHCFEDRAYFANVPTFLQDLAVQNLVGRGVIITSSLIIT